MSPFEAVMAVLVALITGALIPAIITSRHDRWRFSAEREAAKEDRAEEKADKIGELQALVLSLKEDLAASQRESDERMAAIENQNSCQSEALKILLMDRIVHLGQSYIDRGWVALDEKTNLQAIYDVYSNPKGLQGNGDAKIVMLAVNDLPVGVKKHDD